MNTYEIYENNGGALFLCIMDEGRCKRIFENWEYGPAGILSDAIQQLKTDPTAYETWDGDLVERLTYVEEMETDAQSLYEDGLGELIADSTGFIDPHMGFAGKNALNIHDEDEER